MSCLVLVRASYHHGWRSNHQWVQLLTADAYSALSNRPLNMVPCTAHRVAELCLKPVAVDRSFDCLVVLAADIS